VILDIIPEKKRIICKTTASVGDKLVCDGEAKMMVRSRVEEEEKASRA